MLPVPTQVTGARAASSEAPLSEALWLSTGATGDRKSVTFPRWKQSVSVCEVLDPPLDQGLS